MKTKTFVIMSVIVCSQLVFTGLQTGCNTFGGRSGRSASHAAFSDDVFSPGRERAEERLREIVREYIATEQRVSDKASAPVMRRRPYYFKEYSTYPDGTDVFTVDFREVDSRIRPLMAEVRINKIRYSTRMHRKYDRAKADMDFLRDTGVETLVFELRSSRWARTGAIFDAERTEEMINGEWIPRRDETQRVVPSEDRPGWFKRIWLRVSGGEE